MARVNQHAHALLRSASPTVLQLTCPKHQQSLKGWLLALTLKTSESVTDTESKYAVIASHTGCLLSTEISGVLLMHIRTVMLHTVRGILHTDIHTCIVHTLRKIKLPSCSPISSVCYRGLCFSHVFDTVAACRVQRNCVLLCESKCLSMWSEGAPGALSGCLVVWGVVWC